MPEPITPPPDDGKGTPPPTGSGAGDPPKPPETPKKLEFTQEEFDRIIADRVKRATPADYADLQKLKVERDAAGEAEKTELQKAKDAAGAEKLRADAAITTANGRLIRAAILSEAVTQNATDTDIVIALLTGNDEITVDKDGTVLGAKEAVKKLLKDKPVLAKPATPGSSGGGDFGGNDPKGKLEKIAALEQAANDPKLTAQERQAKYREARELKFST